MRHLLSPNPLMAERPPGYICCNVPIAAASLCTCKACACWLRWRTLHALRCATFWLVHLCLQSLLKGCYGHMSPVMRPDWLPHPLAES